MEYRVINARVDGELTELYAKDGKLCRADEIGEGATVIDAGGATVRPGLVEIHSHGCLGYDTMDGHLSEMAAYQFRHGVTSWLPTTMTMPLSDIKAATDVIPERGEGEAKIVGFHLEGPYIAEKYKGAQNSDYLALPSLKDLGALRNYKMITVAPELEGAMEFIRGADAVISLGHSAADYETGERAFRCGARCLTHTCNAMAPLHHRDPALIGAAMVEGGYAQVICDGVHIHKAMVLALYRMFGPERMILISDSMRATGLSDGIYSFGGQAITVRDGVARTEDGALAGSTASLYDCVRKAVEFGIPEEDAYRMASKTPAELMGWRKGALLPGYDAELILVGEKGELIKTLILD